MSPRQQRRYESGSSDAAPAAGSVSTADSGGATESDFAHFVWDKLNAVDGRLADLSEKHGRIDARMDIAQQALLARLDTLERAIDLKLDGAERAIGLRIDAAKTATDKLEGKVSKLESTVRMATAIFIVIAALFSGGLAIYKVVENHISVKVQ
ncbi:MULTISPECIES: hypothetical protein [Burkholderia cepacia complex]|nr:MULTISPECIES: hypothetical protein [Burkholderia cepacia complex]